MTLISPETERLKTCCGLAVLKRLTVNGERSSLPFSSLHVM